MTRRQKILRLVYPIYRKFNRMLKGKRAVLSNTNDVRPSVPFHALRSTLSDGTLFDFSVLKGKKVLLVNLASDCGYTPQYDELEKLHRQNKDKLVVLGFPANDFKGQEPGNDDEIDNFCRKEYSITFPLFRKHPVLPPDQQEVFRWLSNKEMNGWNDQSPSWNFSKYLVDETGKLEAFFAPFVSPLSRDVVGGIK